MFALGFKEKNSDSLCNNCSFCLNFCTDKILVYFPQPVPNTGCFGQTLIAITGFCAFFQRLHGTGAQPQLQ
jgi:hypothetical protein